MTSQKFSVVAALAVCCVVPARARKPAISVTISVPDSDIRMGHPIPLKVELTNRSNAQIKVARGIGDAEAEVTCSVVMFGRTGRPVQRTTYGEAAEKQQLVSSVRVVSIQPRASLTQTMELTKLFRITHPGTYTVRVGRKWPEGTRQMNWSNTLTLTISQVAGGPGSALDVAGAPCSAFLCERGDSAPRLPATAPRYSLNAVSFENRCARFLISLFFNCASRSTPNRSTAKLPITDPYTMA